MRAWLRVRLRDVYIELDQYVRFKKLLIRKYDREYSHRIKDLSNNDKWQRLLMPAVLTNIVLEMEIDSLVWIIHVHDT